MGQRCQVFMQQDLSMLKELYKQGKNITEILRSAQATSINSPEIIEIAYDLQAGSYINEVTKNSELAAEYANAIVKLIEPWVLAGDNILDAGTGELTTYGPVMNQLEHASGYACDLSISRLTVGKKWMKSLYPDVHNRLNAFVADLSIMPFRDAAMDVTWTSHAIEPNHGRESQIITELLRITKRVLILFEPHYESASIISQQRMQKHGYARNLEKAIRDCGGELIKLVKLNVSSNPLNQTHCYVIKPIRITENEKSEGIELGYECPKTRQSLDLMGEGCIMSSSGYYAYPLVAGIPLLRSHLGFPFTNHIFESAPHDVES